ncbi:type II secretion system protein [Kiritimatiella glycovorans]|uniref:Type II secretion system protein G n=1 Tax=Kiritimatiella glycovorans TaxID=1307763 RepID=A0A0G3EEV8_9BACT|nr:type II secretion system protein [Kiritimatiella glycovorans]AKJ64843.1 type II secretion system protein G [Kiritimatiella glycovorans]
MNTKKRNKKSGFTLIELLIVIGLMGALVALVLPKLTADRRESMMDVSQYNKAGTIRTLYQYEEITGKYPNDMHSGLTNAASGGRMPGMQKSMAFNISNGGGPKPASIQPLTTNMVASLNAAGITSLCYDSGFNSRTLAVGDYVVMSCNPDGEQWLHKHFTPHVGSTGKGKITFEGRALDEWVTDMNGGASDGVIIPCWVTPTIDWQAGSGDNTDWTKGNVELGISMEGQAPVPTEDAEGGNEVNFAYYTAHFLVDDDDTDGIQPAKLIGVMCGKPLNP